VPGLAYVAKGGAIMRLGKRNQRVTMDEFRPFLIAMMILLAIYCVISSEMEADKEPQRRYFEPVSSKEFGTRRFTGISQIVEAGENLYILPNDHNGFIQVYDLNGNYRHSLFFTESMNGAFTMAYENGMFYVQDQTGNVYVFQEGEFKEYVKREKAQERFADIAFVWQSSTPGYELLGSDLWRVSEAKEVLVIDDLLRVDTRSMGVTVGVLLALAVFWLSANYLKRRNIYK
jgi:hypothetical protein